PRPRYVLAVRLYAWAFAAEPSLADDIKDRHRYNAVCIAVRAAAGKDGEMAVFGAEEWGHLTGLARKWLRANLAQLAPQAKGPKRRDVREALTRWKKDADLAPVRDPAWLAAMPPDDRRAWERLWADVDALLASVGQPARSPAKP